MGHDARPADSERVRASQPGGRAYESAGYGNAPLAYQGARRALRNHPTNPASSHRNPAAESYHLRDQHLHRYLCRNHAGSALTRSRQRPYTYPYEPAHAGPEPGLGIDRSKCPAYQ